MGHYFSSKGKFRKSDQHFGSVFQKIAATGHSSGTFGQNKSIISRIAELKMAAGGHSCGTKNLVTLPELTFTRFSAVADTLFFE